MVNKQRLIDEFLELVQIDSPSSKEGKVAQVLVKKLEEIGCEVIIENGIEKTGGQKIKNRGRNRKRNSDIKRK